MDGLNDGSKEKILAMYKTNIKKESNMEFLFLFMEIKFNHMIGKNIKIKYNNITLI